MRALRASAVAVLLVLTVALIGMPAANAAAATHLVLTAPSSSPAGNTVAVTVTAVDGSGATDTSYSDAVTVTTSDSAAVSPAAATLTNGVGVFAVAMQTLGTQSIAAVDTTTSSVTGAVAYVIVYGTVTHLGVSGPTQLAGSAQTTTVTALDAANDVVPTFADTVGLST